MGKNIGGTLGGPFEGDKAIRYLNFYEPVPTEPMPNDDLDLQLAWLLMLEELRGGDPTLTDFASAWTRWLKHYPWDEYGICLMNLEAGLLPPMCGGFRNGYIDNMGSPIRSEIWACLAPGEPGRAAMLALRDAALDHAGGEGMYGEMFWAALQSAAFVIGDPGRLIRIGLGVIPLHCRIARVIRQVLVMHERGLTYEQARDKVRVLFASDAEHVRTGDYLGLTDGGVVHPCHAVPNHGFTVLGWLYGEGFGDMLCKAVNCGHDTDCSAATLGATLGILQGHDALPESWITPIGRDIVLHRFTGQLDAAPKTIDELTDRTLAVAQRSRERRGKAGEALRSPDDLRLAAEVLSAFDPQTAEIALGDLTFRLHYHGEPVMHPDERRWVTFDVEQHGRGLDAEVEWELPTDWSAEYDADAKGWWMTAATMGTTASVTARVKIEDTFHRASFVWMPPSQALWPVELNVPKCKACRARLGACLCGSR